MKRFCALAILCSGGPLLANMGPAGFYDFPNYYFVETGTSGGGGIDRAKATGLFTEIYSMEIDPSSVNYALSRFPSDLQVHILQGDSSIDLAKLINSMQKPITFWLDAHSGLSDNSGKKNTPLMEELEQIKHHPIKTHTILIDDMHCTGTLLFDYVTKEQIIQKLLEINPNYIIGYVPGGEDGEYPDNIMVARVKPENVELYLNGRLPRTNGRYLTFKESLTLLAQRRVYTLVETGTARYGDTNFEGDGGSTIIFGHWAKDHGAKLFSVDINQSNISHAKAAASPYLENVELVLQDSVQFLKQFPNKIDFLYLGSYDYDEQNPKPSQVHALNELLAAYDKLTDHSIVMIDDCNIPGGGKGKWVIIYLLQHGWYLQMNRHQVILLKNPQKFNHGGK